jgi:hypothetical protein
MCAVPEDTMTWPNRRSQQKLARVRLVARTRMAWEQLRDVPHDANRRSASRARMRLAVLNRAMALLALQG